MICVHIKDGNTIHLDPTIENNLCYLDNRRKNKLIRRVAIIDKNGKRTDLPLNKNGAFIIWIELVKCGDYIKGERVCMKNSYFLLRATLYYSDLRVVLDLDISGGFISGKRTI